MRPFGRGAAALATALLVAACGGGASTNAPTSPAATSGSAVTSGPGATTGGGGAVCAPSDGAASVVNAVVGNAWDPPTITAKVGDVLQWANGDGVPHGVELDGGPRCTSSIQPGGTASTSFTQPGTYPFHCFVHPSMKGTITITS